MFCHRCHTSIDTTRTVGLINAYSLTGADEYSLALCDRCAIEFQRRIDLVATAHEKMGKRTAHFLTPVHLVVFEPGGLLFEGRPQRIVGCSRESVFSALADLIWLFAPMVTLSDHEIVGLNDTWSGGSLRVRDRSGRVVHRETVTVVFEKEEG